VLRLGLGLHIGTEDKSLILGALAGTGTLLGINYVLKQIPGALGAIVFREDNGQYIWGLGTGNMVTIATGAGLTYLGHRKHDPKIKYFGFGWLLATALEKLYEIGRYIQTVQPVWTDWEWTVTGKVPTASMQTRVTSAQPTPAPATRSAVSKYTVSVA
jgi:hypothetical protein